MPSLPDLKDRLPALAAGNTAVIIGAASDIGLAAAGVWRDSG